MTEETVFKECGHFASPLESLHVFSRISGDNIEVSITDGRILGRKLETDKGTQFFAFQDIPYAKPPIDELRFKAPVPPEKWEGVLNTTENRKVCIQFSKPDDPRENEDCLVLNVYTPSIMVDAWVGCRRIKVHFHQKTLH
ncbi:hypothetical protein JTB14_023098 [Gonioctena quinquepunctata]|nr:hypothetical protein JTB14_023098 [Gonioctena quinquepunctata]